ncbi:DUF2811 domain-containing protein [Candidatus Cyanaurora vandensis]|uniref:DUF2811 domain-containing protein n=1 Tax=Candidatus Cyanaurora vandensis TaxID=2714958 RepID=UPI00257BFDC2|nr:DUF2811 domain-containing protein [Candidatus Cyanaurora vandensis]
MNLTTECVLAVLESRRDRKLAGLTATELVRAAVGCAPGPDETRQLRKIIAMLRLQGQAIAACPTKGYYLADSPEALLTGINYLRGRALHSLKQISRQRRVLKELAGQLRLGLDPKTTALNKEIAMTSVLAEIPDELHTQVTAWLGENQEWDETRLYQAALAMFLMQHGVPNVGRTYLNALFGKPEVGDEAV